MPRIVKAGAIYSTTTDIPQGHGFRCYLVSNTVEIKPGWMPENWSSLKSAACRHDKYCLGKIDSSKCAGCECVPEFEAGFDACLNALNELKEMK